MTTQAKLQYTSPMCEELRLQSDGIMGVSPGEYPEWEEEDING